MKRAVCLCVCVCVYDNLVRTLQRTIKNVQLAFLGRALLLNIRNSTKNVITDLFKFPE